MLLSKATITKWNSKTKNYYVNLGYIFTKMGEEFEVLVEHLPQTSLAVIAYSCDYCGIEMCEEYGRYTNIRKDIIDKDCCLKCRNIKKEETFLKTLGVRNPLLLDSVKEKVSKTNLERYGSENPFGSEKIKNKIEQTMINKYGNSSYTRTDEYHEKRKNTCLRKYGVESHMSLPKYKEMFSGEKSPVWKGGVHNERWDRLQPKYKTWRNFVYKRDAFICQKCNEKTKFLECHHIFNWNDYPELRYDLENGITFCKNCHINFHRIYGKKDNNKEQLVEFLNKDK